MQALEREISGPEVGVVDGARMKRIVTSEGSEGEWQLPSRRQRAARTKVRNGDEIMDEQ